MVNEAINLFDHGKVGDELRILLHDDLVPGAVEAFALQYRHNREYSTKTASLSLEKYFSLWCYEFSSSSMSSVTLSTPINFFLRMSNFFIGYHISSILGIFEPLSILLDSI
jgi:hypothetical protein